MAFDIKGALAEGYSYAEIADHLASQKKFDIAGARNEGYSDIEIAQHLAGKPIKQNKSFLGDVKTDIKRGLEQLPGAITGLADIPFGAVAGVTPISSLAEKAGELTGFQPSKWAQEAAQEYSPERLAAEQAVEQAQGFGENLKAYATEPRALAGVITQALPLTLAGGVAGRAAGAAAGIRSAAARAGIGEGAISSGAMMDALTQGETGQEDIRKKAIAAGIAGPITGVISAGSSKLASRLGIVDPDSIFNAPKAQTLSDAQIDKFLGAARRSLGVRVGLGMLQEGVLEELPQSIQEQMFQNWASNKPILEGVDKAAVTGLVAGAGMGAGFNLVSRGMSEADVRAEVERRRVENAKRIQTNLDRMASEAMGGTRESRPAEFLAAERARQEREVDLAALNKINEDYTKALRETKDRASEIAATTQSVLAERPDLQIAHVIQKTDTVEGIQDLLKNFDSYFSFETKKDADELKKQLQKQLTATKKAETAAKKLSPQERQFYTMMEAYDTIKEKLGVDTQTDLRNKPVEELQAALNDHEAKMADSKLPKKKQPLFTEIYNLLTDAIENNTATEVIEEAKQPTKLTREDMRQYQEKAQLLEAPIEQQEIPEEAWQQPQEEVPSAEELWAKQQEQEAADFELLPQYQTPTTPESTEVIEEEAYEQAPKSQTELFTQTGRPTKAAMRGTPSGVRQRPIELQGDVDSNEMSNQSRAAEDEEAAQPESVPLGDDSGYLSGVEPRTRRGKKPKQSTLDLAGRVNAIRSDAVRVNQMAKDGGYKLPDQIAKRLSGLIEMQPRNEEEFTRWNDAITEKIMDARTFVRNKTAELAEQRRAKAKAEEMPAEVAQDMEDAEQREYEENQDYFEQQAFAPEELGDFGYDPDEPLYSRRKAGKQAGKTPKQVRAQVREDSKEPTTVESLQKTVKNWFNPVWYENAVNSGWLQIVDGTINDTELPDSVKEAYPDAKAVFMPDGRVYLFAKNIPKGNELGVVLHEIGEHKGLEKLIGKERVTQLASRIREMAKSKGRDAEIAQKAMDMAKGERAGDKELIAYFGEIAVNNYGLTPGAKNKPQFGKAIAWLTDLWNSLTTALAKFHIDPSAIKGQQVVDLLYGAARLQMGDQAITNAFVEAQDAEVMASKGLKLTPEEENFFRSQGIKPFSIGEKPSMKRKMMDLMGGESTTQDMADRIGNKIVGPLYAISRKMTKAYGPEAFYNPETGKFFGHLQAQHSLNSIYFASGALKNGTLEINDKGSAVIVDKEANAVKLVNDYNALIEAIQADGQSEAMAHQLASFAMLADRYKELQKIGQKTKAEFPEAAYRLGKDTQEKYKSQFDTWRGTYQEMRNNKRQALKASGRYTDKEIDTLLDRSEYVPLYRIKDSEGIDGVYMQHLLSANYAQKLQFDTKEFDVADVMGNIMKNEMWLYQQIMKNNTTNLMVDDMLLMEKEFGKEFGGHFVPAAMKNNKNVFSFYRDGELKNLYVNNINDMAMFEAQPLINGTAMRIARTVSGFLRRGITATPSFWYRQSWQDGERAWMQGGSKQSFLKAIGTNAQQQFQNMSKESPLAQEMRKLGLVGQVDFQDSFDHFLNNLLGRTPTGWQGVALKTIEKAERFAQNSDLAARASVYKASIDDGYTPQEAALRAQMMINYNHKGTSALLRALLTTVPFVNAKIQSDWRLVEAVKGNIPGVSKEKAKQLIAMKVAKLAMFTLLYAAARSGDDDYEDASDEKRDRNFLFNIGGVPISVPVAPEYLAIKAAVEHGYRTSTEQEFETGSKFAHAMKSSAINLMVSPTDVMPSIFRPLLENITNYSFFSGRALVGPGLARQATPEQYVKGQTSELAKEISQVMFDMFGNDIAISPIKIDNWIRGTFGSMGADILATTNLIAEGLSDSERPALKLNQLPEVGAMFYDPEGGQRKADYYNLRDQVEPIYNTYLKKRKENPAEAREYFEDYKDYIRLMPQLNAIGNQLEPIRAQRNRIMEDPKLDADEKREKLDALSQREKRMIGDRVQRMLDKLE